MVKKFLQKLHDLCHEYETHKSHIRSDENVQRILKRCWGVLSKNRSKLLHYCFDLN
jgi:hypothetical protein